MAKLEKRADMYVSNLRRYIEALGGALEITATFPEGRVTITNFSDLGKAKPASRRRREGRMKRCAGGGELRVTGELLSQDRQGAWFRRRS